MRAEGIRFMASHAGQTICCEPDMDIPPANVDYPNLVAGATNSSAITGLEAAQALAHRFDFLHQIQSESNN